MLRQLAEIYINSSRILNGQAKITFYSMYDMSRKCFLIKMASEKILFVQ